MEEGKRKVVSIRSAAAVLLLVLTVAGTPAWISGKDVPYLIRACSYSFFHANIFHLLANLLGIWALFRPGCRTEARDITVGYLISVAVYAFASRPVIGMSNLLFAVVGLRSPSFSSGWWRRPTTIVFLAVTFIMLLIPQFSGLTHVAALAVGVILASIRRSIQPIIDDADRLSR